ncbi:HesA/MoeB/ThiF family protein [Olivibacter domesticus]|uniref:Molybdopterin-synthase adenylyltransferase n=1 Tax=Olivibacter domesticus TaxID=407022 RepID=A0A1H7MC90_OLID1|nr:HesA/MoeB/ThiF family protein [Olivibacter domesticus]SEL08906.1 adenylyltransferase and sulfurtransferase [Olivibacter domesticus]
MENDSFHERYHRQIILKEFGAVGQNRLKQAKVLVIGAGGLGCPVLLYLVAGGVGTIGIVDDGLVELSNLHRQVLFNTSDIGKRKVDCAAQLLSKMNPDVAILTYPDRMETSNALDLIDAYDIVIDGTDNFQSRYMINDACVLLNRPLIFGAISRYEGQVAVFKDGFNYRDIFPQPPQEGEVMNCSEAGVLNVLPGLIGNLLVNECIKLITGIGDTLVGKLQTYNMLNNGSFTIEITSTLYGSSLIPKNRESFEATDYHYLCNAKEIVVNELSKDELLTLLNEEEIDLIDVRELSEQPTLNGFNHLRIPLASLEKHASLIKKDTVVFVCQSGKRSKLAARRFEEIINQGNRRVFSLEGGVLSLINTI